MNDNRKLYIAEIDGDTRFQNVTLEIKENLILYLLFYIDEDHKGKYMISEAAQTRLQNIKKNKWYDDKKHKAHCIPIQSVDEIIEQTAAIIKKNEKKNVLIAEMGVFSHASGDGPISYGELEITNGRIVKYGPVKICPDKDYRCQMLLCGWEQINVKWALNAKCVFYGCNTGNPLISENFAENISNLPNFNEVEIWGQSSYSFPSFYPDFRVTSVARSAGDNGTGWDTRGQTYQVAGNTGEGKKALSFRPDKDTLSKEALTEGGYPKANLMNCYKNGKLIKSDHQGVFNDHR